MQESAEQARRRRWTVMLGALACAWQACATPPGEPVFRILNRDDGLPSNQVQALTLDAAGRLWIGTGFGLARYDGHEIRTWLPRADDPGSLASGSVEALLTDPRGGIWVGTEGGNLARFDPARDAFVRIPLSAVAANESVEIWSLTANAQSVYAGTYGAGILELGYDGQVRRRLGPADGLTDSDIVDILASGESALWVLTYGYRLLRLDLEARRADPVPLPAAAFGIARRGEGLLVSTRDGQRCEVSASLAVRCEPIPRMARPNAVRMLLPDARGLWLGGNAELLRERHGLTQLIRFEPGRIGGIPRQRLWTGVQDRDLGLWMASPGGGILHLPLEADRFSVWQPSYGSSTGLRDGRVTAVTLDASGGVWITTHAGGLHRLDPLSGDIEPVALDLPAETLWQPLFEAPDRLWLARKSGVDLYRIAPDRRLQPLRRWAAPELLEGVPDLLYRTPDGQIWASAMGAGVNRIDTAGAVHRYPFEHGEFIGTETQMIGAGLDGAVWIATDRGLYAWHASCDCLRTLIADARVSAYALAPDERVYAMVDGQLVLYQWRGGLYRAAEQAPRAFAEFQSAGGMQWLDGALWLAGTQGLFRYDPALDALSTWRTGDGLPTTEFRDRPFYTDAAGGLWLGTDEGLVRADTRLSLLPDQRAHLRLERAEVDGRDGWRRLDTSQPSTLSADDRSLTVSVRLDTLARASAQRFSFRLDGLDQDWSMPTQRVDRAFGSVPPGRYTLRVRAWDGYGRPAIHELAWPLTVAPPWWASPLAYALYALAVVAAMVSNERWRRRRRRVAESLKEARRKAEWAEQLASEKSALIAELSHEIRNPLNGMLGMARLLGEGSLPASARRYLDLLRDAGQQLTALLDDVLDWSRLNAGRADLPLQPVDLQAFLQSASARYGELARQKGLTLSTEVAADLWVQAAPARLAQILDNLLSNALKYTPAGSVHLYASVHPDLAEQVLIGVRDTGPGLSSTELERLFTPFERLSTGRHVPGTGLGLAISRTLAERMGGQLSARSTAGSGAEFCLRLPRAQPGAAAPTPAPAPPVRPASGLRVLVVEDDPLGREVLEALLREHAAQVYSASDGLTALLLARTEAIDVALVDWDLPGMSGLELARVLAAAEPRPHLIAVTGRAMPEDWQRGREAGFDAHLPKPVQPDALLAALAAAPTGRIEGT